MAWIKAMEYFADLRLKFFPLSANFLFRMPGYLPFPSFMCKKSQTPQGVILITFHDQQYPHAIKVKKLFSWKNKLEGIIQNIMKMINKGKSIY